MGRSSEEGPRYLVVPAVSAESLAEPPAPRIRELADIDREVALQIAEWTFRGGDGLTQGFMRPHWILASFSGAGAVLGCALAVAWLGPFGWLGSGVVASSAVVAAVAQKPLRFRTLMRELRVSRAAQRDIEHFLEVPDEEGDFAHSADEMADYLMECVERKRGDRSRG